MRAGSANRYFQSLDAAVLRAVGPGNPYGCYLLTTYLIEVRAGQVYTTYNRLLSERGYSLSLRSILREEAGHLAEMSGEISRIALEGFIDELTILEANAFGRFLDRLESEVGISGYSGITSIPRIVSVHPDDTTSQLPAIPVGERMMVPLDPPM